MKVMAIIPARYDSVRFPGKPLIDLAGKPMIQHVYERACQVSLFQRVIVATDDVRIRDAVRAFGGDAVMTSPHHQTGTDRLAEVAHTLDVDLVVNVQGDEPLIQPAMIEQAVQPLLADEQVAIGTLKQRIVQPEDLFNPNIVKVVADRQDRALYFSRSPLPFVKGVDMRGAGFHTSRFYRHIGLYAYRRDFLLRFTTLPQTPLEIAEGLEQLRALEYGDIIKVIETEYESIGVDTPADVAPVVALMRQT